MKNNILAFIKVGKKLLYILNKKQKKDSVIVYFVMLFSAGLELAVVSSIYPLLEVMMQTDNLKSKWYIKIIYNMIPNVTYTELILCLGCFIIVCYFIKNIIGLASVYIQNKFAGQFQRELSTLMLQTFLKKPYEFFLNTNSSIVLRGINADVTGVYNIMLDFFSICSDGITTVLLGIYLIYTDSIMAIGALTLVFICMMVSILKFKNKMKKAGKEMQIAKAWTSRCAYQSVSGVKEIKVMNRVDNFVKEYDEACELRQKVMLTNAFLAACPARLIEALCVGGFLGIVCLKYVIIANPKEFIPVVGTFVMAALKLLPSVSKISANINNIVFLQPQLDEVCANLQGANSYMKDVENCNQNETLYEQLGFNKQITLKDITWKYSNSSNNILNNLYLEINKGDTIALIGSSGAGKTTLADIIMGLLIPQTGTVEMDGINIFEMKSQWAKIIGYVPQTVFLIDDTLRKNVAFGVRNSDISDEKIWKALEQAHLKEFVQKLPEGLDTIVGERGVKFSGGQRQRVAIARALYEDSEIIVFDEATSALDTETEKYVMESLEALRGRKTLLIIAHRLTTIQKCNKIYEIKDGKAFLRTKDEVLGKENTNDDI